MGVELGVTLKVEYLGKHGTPELLLQEHGMRRYKIRSVGRASTR